MDELLQKYFDGELSEREAAGLEEMLARDPDLESEMRKIERALGTAAEESTRGPSPGFSEGVMLRVGARARSARSRVSPWLTRMVWAAACLAAFVLGRSGHVTLPGNGGDAAETAMTATAPSGAGPFRVARLVYVPGNAAVERVSVAGTFNDWNPDVNIMERVGEVWVIYVALPPAAYEYMFVEDGRRWITDPLAAQTRDDGFGRRNAVLDLTL
jgi:anti-sigma factor RsiW